MRRISKDDASSESDDAKGGTTSTDQLLNAVGSCHPYSLFVTVSMAFLWTLSAMPTMVPAYISPSRPCRHNCTFVTVQQEFQMKRTWFDPAELTTSVYFMGNLFLGQIYCIAADRIGRRPVLVWSLIGSGLSGSLAAVAPNFELMLAGRFFQGSFFSAITMVNWVMCGECIPFSGHGCASVLFGLFWVLGYCVVAPLGMYLPSWRHVQLATSAPTLIFGLFMLCTLPESVSFLIAKRRSREVEQWVKRANHIGRTGVRCDVAKTIGNETASVADESSVLDCLRVIFSDRQMVVCLVVQGILWICDFLIYNGLSITSTSVGGDNPNLSYIFSGLAELPCYLLMPLALDHLGRKPTVIGSHIVTAGALICMIFTTDTAFLVCCLFAKFGMGSAFMCCFVYGAEIFPIQYRNICLGLCATVSNIGAMSSTHFVILDTVFPGLMHLTFAVICVFCACITVILPETKDQHNQHTKQAVKDANTI